MNNPPAFPQHFQPGEPGMTLRDYFAAAAMAGIGRFYEEVTVEKYAKTLYEIADAMLKARAK